MRARYTLDRGVTLLRRAIAMSCRGHDEKSDVQDTLREKVEHKCGHGDRFSLLVGPAHDEDARIGIPVRRYVAQFFNGDASGQAWASRTYGAFLALVYATAIFGGYAADRLIGPDHGVVSEPVVIGDDAFVGTGATILKGVEIGAGAVIGAASVVTKSVPAGEIWAGNPARGVGRVEQT